MSPSLAKKGLPILLLFSLLGILGYELFYAKPHELPSALIGEPVPHFVLPTLSGSATFSEQALQGKVSLINIWATWCYACSLEHPILMKISREYHIPIYSIDYKDDREAAKLWLNEHGNPYVEIGDDHQGDVGIDFGVYGTPETFVINKQGNIVYRHVGAIDQKTWDDVLYPLVLKYQGMA